MYSQGGGAKERNGNIINIHVDDEFRMYTRIDNTCFIYKALKLAETKEIGQFLSAIR